VLGQTTVFVNLQVKGLKVFTASDSPALANGFVVGAFGAVVGNVDGNTLRDSQSLEQSAKTMRASAAVAPAEPVESGVAFITSDDNSGVDNALGAILQTSDVLDLANLGQVEQSLDARIGSSSMTTSVSVLTLPSTHGLISGGFW
jgi:hypothetical protein